MACPPGRRMNTDAVRAGQESLGHLALRMTHDVEPQPDGRGTPRPYAVSVTTDPAHLCRMVDLEWDRGHETFTAIVRAETSTGLVVTEVLDLSALPGFRWIRADEVISIEDRPHTAPEVRLANLRGIRSDQVDAGLTDLRALLAHLQETGGLIAIFTTRSGSEEALVGRIQTLGSEELALDEVDPGGSSTGEVLTYQLSEIIGVDWHTTYLHDLEELLAYGS